MNKKLKINLNKMKNKRKVKPVVNYKKISRDAFIKAGANDSRFTTKVVEDKKKKASRTACRKKVNVILD